MQRWQARAYLSDRFLVWRRLSSSVLRQNFEEKTGRLPRAASSQDKNGCVEVPDNAHFLGGEIKWKFFLAGRFYN